MNNVGIPNLAPIYCGGHEASTMECKLLETRFNGSVGERICIHLRKPRKSGAVISIEETQLPPIIGVTNLDRWAAISIDSPYIIAGTRRKNKVVFYRRDRSRPKPYSGIGFRDKLNIFPGLFGNNNAYETKLYRCDTIDLREILTTKCESNTEENGHENPPIEVNCVLQQKKKMISFQAGSINAQLVGLNKSPNGPDEQIWELICSKLPAELYINIMEYLNYDQVKWLADEDERFARKLANKRYKIDSYDKIKFPDMSALLPTIRSKAANEMRFSRDEDIWLVSFSDYKNPGTAKRLTIEPGIYKWHRANSITSIRFNTNRSRCEYCTEIFNKLQQTMAENQEQTVKGYSQIKVFSLEGSEDKHLDARYTSPYYRGSAISEEYDHSIHMWVNDLENRWLQDVQLKNEWLEKDEYRAFKDFKTLIFKDPVKFFGTTKVFDLVDDGILALTSKMTGEVVGYLVIDEEFRLRSPLFDQGQPKIMGLQFLSPTLYDEMRVADRLVKHIRFHEVAANIKSAKERLHSLRTALLNPLNDTVSLQLGVDSTLTYIQCQNHIMNKNYELTLQDIMEEKIDDNTVHFHEVYEEDFDFCTRYVFNRLGESKTQYITRSTKLMLTRCAYEEQNPNKKCTLKVINPLGLRSAAFAMKAETGLTLDVDFV